MTMILISNKFDYRVEHDVGGGTPRGLRRRVALPEVDIEFETLH